MSINEFRLLAIIAILANKYVRIDYRTRERDFIIKDILDFVSDLSTKPRVVNLFKRAKREKES